jgi:hypothetical protein
LRRDDAGAHPSPSRPSRHVRASRPGHDTKVAPTPERALEAAILMLARLDHLIDGTVTGPSTGEVNHG